MYTLIEYPAGVVVEAVVLSMSRDCARIAAAGFADALELKRCGDDWFSEAGQKVTFDFLFSRVPEGKSTAIPMPAMAARAAGSYMVRPAG